MEQNSREKEIANLVSKVIGDYDGGKNIDATDIFNKPDRNEIIDIVNNLFSRTVLIRPTTSEMSSR